MVYTDGIIKTTRLRYQVHADGIVNVTRHR